MTIASAFNDITVKLGGTPSTSGTVASAIDALNDVLAGSDQPAAQTIEGAVALLGEHISGGSSVTVEALTATENKTYTAPEGKAYSPVTVNVPSGSSDFSTATATIVNTGETPVLPLTLCTCWNEDGSSGLYPRTSQIPAGTSTFTIPLYVGKLYFYDANQMSPIKSVSGNIESIDGGYLITGDCTINVEFSMPG